MRRTLVRMGEKKWYTPEAVAYGLRETERFRFVGEGEVPESRQIPGGTSRLPYMQDYDVDWDWEAGELADPNAFQAGEAISGQPGAEGSDAGEGEPAAANEARSRPRAPDADSQPVTR